MIWRGASVGALVCALSWTVGYYVTKIVAAHAEVASAYGLIVGWWLTAYVCAKLHVPLRSGLILSACYLILFLIAAVIGSTWFYRDAYGLGFWGALVIGIAQAIAIASPIIFNRLIETSTRLFGKTGTKKQSV